MFRYCFKTIGLVVLFFLIYEMTVFLVLKLIFHFFDSDLNFLVQGWKLPFWLIVISFIVLGSRWWKIDLESKLNKISLKKGLRILVTSVLLGSCMFVVFNWYPLSQNGFVIKIRLEELLTFKRLVFVFITLVIAPVLEELLFRGIILEYLSRTNGLFFSVLLSSLLFSLHHLTGVQLLPAFVAGLYLGVLYLKGHSLSCTILAHCCLNIVPVFVCL